MKKLPNKNLIIALVLAVINLIGVFLIFGQARVGEVETLINLMHWLEGKVFILKGLGWYFFRPLAPLLAVPLSLITGEERSLLILSIVFYLFSVYFIFKVTDLIYGNQRQALFASILFAFAVPVLRYASSAHPTDVGSYFFCIVSVYLTLLYLKKRQENLIIWNGLFTGLGILMKESGGMGILFFIMVIFLTKEFRLKEKILKLIKFGAPFLIPVIFWQTLISLTTPFSHSQINMVLTAKNHYLMGSSAIFYILQHFLALFVTFGFLGWLLIFFGGLKEWQNRNQARIKILLALVPFSLVSFLWPPADSRHAFIVGTLGVLLGSYGLVNLKNMFKNKKMALLLTTLVICLYIVFNYSAYYFNDSLPFIDFENILHFFS